MRAFHNRGLSESPMTRILALSCLVVVSCNARAGADNADALTRQVQSLTDQVQELTRRVETLEGILKARSGPGESGANAPASVNAPVSTTVPPRHSTAETRETPAQAAPVPGTVERSNAVNNASSGTAPTNLTPPESWARLEEGMTQAQVLGLLGEPTSKFKVSGQTVWYYYYRDVGGGSVFFYNDGHVASRQRPPFSAWRW